MNVSMTSNLYKAAVVAKNVLSSELVDAYIQVANAYIKEAAYKGEPFAFCYCPYKVAEMFCKILREKGFIVEKNPYRSNFYNIVWDEGEYRKKFQFPSKK